MNEHERRQTLADFLRTQRSRLSPEDVGLSAGMRRRTPGLRREEVAQLANIGSSWYVRLEQGRDVHPSVSVLESLAQALKLTLNERRHLFLLAGEPLPPHAFPLEEPISPALQQLLSELTLCPAYVLGRRWDYLAWNNAAEHVFGIDQSIPPHTNNQVWRFFANPGSKKRYPDWEGLALEILTEFHAASIRYPGDPWFEELIEDLKAISSEFRQWWPEYHPTRTMDSHKFTMHETLGKLKFEHVTLQLPSDPDVKTVIYTPDTITRTKLQRILGKSDQPARTKVVHQSAYAEQ
ncbi:MAG TPA: helix-turn-helix transcriptional regulator [Dictyobacter sp.]|jgi:transcriptional regulator with XRE-family HTH domain|nr:helix-turn-helix transcriptional regulator [Dictyobacter sp.]